MCNRYIFSSRMRPKYLPTTFILTIVVGCSSIMTTPLDDYVNTPDHHYNYTFLTSFRAPNVTVHVLNMTSQKWLDERWSNRPIWWHYVVIIVPDKLSRNDTGMLYIDGGHNTDKIPTIDDKLVALLYTVSVSTGTVVTCLKQIPNEPIVFKGDPTQRQRTEDAIIAWTWKIFLENGTNPEVLLRLPMTKAAVRAMDTVTTYCEKHMKINIGKFFVAGASKRGWTTWTTAAVDKRVIGFTPIVMDLLNVNKNLHHYIRSLGGWTFAFDQYYNENITSYMDSANIERMRAVIDPLTYNDRYINIPKCVISSTGDEFFLPDDSHYYYNELKGPKFLRIVPNAEHSMIGHIGNVLLGMKSFYVQIMNATPLPSLRWERINTATGGKIILWTDREPSSAFMYHASTLNDGRRDFRFARWDQETGKAVFHPVLWFSREVKKISATHYEAELDIPLTGWAAFFIQVTFDCKGNNVLEFTTETNIVPDTFPFNDCHGTGCYGTLV